MSYIVHTHNQAEMRFETKEALTGCPRQAKVIPPHVADTITTTRSEINLQ